MTNNAVMSESSVALIVPANDVDQYYGYDRAFKYQCIVWQLFGRQTDIKNLKGPRWPIIRGMCCGPPVLQISGTFSESAYLARSMASTTCLWVWLWLTNNHPSRATCARKKFNRVNSPLFAIQSFSLTEQWFVGKCGSTNADYSDLLVWPAQSEHRYLLVQLHDLHKLSTGKS